MLEGASQQGWMRGTVVAQADPFDAYGVFLQADPSGGAADLRVVVDPPTTQDVALLLRGPRGETLVFDEHGPGGAEMARLPQDGAYVEAGPWSFGVLLRESATAGAAGPVGTAGSSLPAMDYEMAVICHPYC